MKILIASDIHGDAECAKKLVEEFYRTGADKLLLLGDVLYHGPRNELPSGYAPKAVISVLNGIKDKILCVRGNCDTEVDQMVLEFPILADYSFIAVDGLEILATHGHNYNMNTVKNLSPNTILLHGHTHVPVAEPFGNGNVYINPGSTSIPKENSPRSYILYEDRCFSFRKLDDGSEYKRYEAKNV